MSNDTTTLVIFGEEFEKHGGLRVLAMADTMHEEDPVDDMEYYVDSCEMILEDDLAFEGYKDPDDLLPLAEVCFDLRMKHGHEDWVSIALLAYLRDVKGVQSPEAARDRMLSEASERFAPIYSAFRHRRDLDQVEHLKAAIAMYEKMAANDRKWLAELEAKLALVA